jgi:hypothetical protein
MYKKAITTESQVKGMEKRAILSTSQAYTTILITKPSTSFITLVKPELKLEMVSILFTNSLPLALATRASIAISVIKNGMAKLRTYAYSNMLDWFYSKIIKMLEILEAKLSKGVYKLM